MDSNIVRAILASDVQAFPQKGAIMLNWQSLDDGSSTYSLSVTDLATNNQVVGKTGATKPSRITKVNSKDTVKNTADQDVDENEDKPDTPAPQDDEDEDNLGF